MDTFVYFRKVMDSDELTTEQAGQKHESLFRLANYLHRVVKRMENWGFPPNDRLYEHAKRAYDAVCSLRVELRYISYTGGVGKTRKEN
jgi:hypothetical protein